jgi:hypothetical protein
MTISLDFDGTCVEHAYPYIGKDLPLCVQVLHEIINSGNRICLCTMRYGDNLQEAVEWFKNRKIQLFGVNENPTQWAWTNSPKVYADIIIDDTALGCPIDKHGFVDWASVRSILVTCGVIKT